MKTFHRICISIFIIFGLLSTIGCTSSNRLKKSEDILKEDALNIVLSQIDSKNEENIEWPNSNDSLSFFQSLIDLDLEYDLEEELWYFDNSPVISIIDYGVGDEKWKIDFPNISKEQMESRVGQWIIVDVKRDENGKISNLEKSENSFDVKQFREYNVIS